ncbi:hypothetical protein EDB89DRAFT_176025 [Lactarius sanguifluus]|nr:hypothetical protein EDB89DRAFT_176025 [Lactarius sanguifluus]
MVRFWAHAGRQNRGPRRHTTASSSSGRGALESQIEGWLNSFSGFLAIDSRHSPVCVHSLSRAWLCCIRAKDPDRTRAAQFSWYPNTWSCIGFSYSRPFDNQTRLLGYTCLAQPQCIENCNIRELVRTNRSIYMPFVPPNRQSEHQVRSHVSKGRSFQVLVLGLLQFHAKFAPYLHYSCAVLRPLIGRPETRNPRINKSCSMLCENEPIRVDPLGRSYTYCPT